MGLFKKKEKRPAEYLEENRRLLDEFNVTKAWGIKKYRVAMQFVYDMDKRQFVVVEGPIDDPSVDFRDKNPDVVSFDQVKDVWLEVDEYWTEGNGEFETRPLNQNLLQERYKEVYWRYDFYLNIETDHPYAGTIRYQMNFKPTITKVPQHGITFKRGVGIGGTYRGEEIEQLALELQAFEEDEKKAEDVNRKLDIILVKNKGKSFLEGVGGNLVKDAKNEIYYKKLANMGAHAARADRISKLLLG